MRRIAHLSDLHFGRTDPAVLLALTATLRETKPHVVVVSGDLTQRARNREFAAARDYLASLAVPLIVVPGNHDVPLYNVYMRAFHPLARYRRYFGDDPTPCFIDDEIAIVGVNTARAMTFKDGRINSDQAAHVCRRVESLSGEVTRIVVTHHPFEASDGDRVGRADMAMAHFADCRIDLILSGHLHAVGTAFSTGRYRLEGYSALLVQAGTATSIRRRGEPNSFNLIHVDGSEVAIERQVWDAARRVFTVAAADRFRRTAGQWAGDTS